MNKIIIYTLLLLVFVAENGFSEETEKEINSKETIGHVIKKSLGAFRFNVIGTKTISNEGQPTEFEFTTIDTIEVYNANNKLIQTINLDGCVGCAVSEFHDINFDGYDDLFILVGSGSGGDTYDVWLFNPRNRLFEKWESLSNIVIDNKRKTLTETTIRDAFTYEKYYYKVINNKLVNFQTEERFRTEDHEIVTEIKVMTRGKWWTKSRKVEEDD